MRYCDGSAECESECFDYSTDLTKVQVTESSRHKHHLPVKAPPRNVGNLCIKKRVFMGRRRGVFRALDSTLGMLQYIIFSTSFPPHLDVTNPG